MIIISTNRRGGGPGLHAWAEAFAARVPATTHLRAPDSTAVAVQQCLRDNPGTKLFFFGHGLNPPAAGFMAQDEVAAVDATTIGLLAGRTIGATCCYGDQIGPLAAGTRFSIFGYAKELQIPTDASHIQEMTDAAISGPEVLANGGTPAEAAETARKAFYALATQWADRGAPLDFLLRPLAAMNAEIASAW